MNSREELVLTTAGHNSAIQGMGQANETHGARGACAVGFGMLQAVLRIWRAAMRNASEEVFQEFVRSQLNRALEYVVKVHPQDVANEAGDDTVAVKRVLN